MESKPAKQLTPEEIKEQRKLKAEQKAAAKQAAKEKKEAQAAAIEAEKANAGKEEEKTPIIEENKQPAGLNDKKLNHFSRALVQILRHSAESKGIFIRSDGYIKLDDLFQAKDIKKFNATLDDTFKAVNTNDKKRMEMMEEDGVWYIRAVQGHTISKIENDELLDPITCNTSDAENVFNFTEVVHGTYHNVLELIMNSGLCRMARNHVHFAVGLPGKNGVISGMRSSAEVVFEINMTQAQFEGNIPFFISKNRVVLSPGEGEKGIVPARFIRSVFEPNSKKAIFQQPFDFICVYDFECNCIDNKDET